MLEPGRLSTSQFKSTTDYPHDWVYDMELLLYTINKSDSEITYAAEIQMPRPTNASIKATTPHHRLDPLHAQTYRSAY
jgi:hypothetical protein